MEDALRNAIERQARKLIERHKRDRFSAATYQRRFRLRTGTEPIPGQGQKPRVWTVGPHFDPIYCIRHSRFLARTIWRKLIDRTYSVEPALLFRIPKDGGGQRDVMVFTIPDAAVANLFNRRLRDRNKNLQSPFCYSYRKDRTIFDAALQTSSLLPGDKVYVVQYDFSKYFDSIKHEYIRFVVDGTNFLISPMERFVINKFLRHRFAAIPEYKAKIFETRTLGVPQGCSLSLFLSNIAAHELDKELEKINGMFVRFADDVVCVTREFGDAKRIEQVFADHCYYTGISINLEKSPGICFLHSSRPGGARDYIIDNEDIGKVKTIEEFDYIGHKFARDRIQISTRAVARIKRKISRIIYIHLLHNPRRGLFSTERVGPLFYDWDLVTCINELRRYIYGGLRQERLVAFIGENRRIERFKGLMSFYPLVTTVDQFARLDGWLAAALRRAIKTRSVILKKDHSVSLKPLSNAELISGSWYQYQSGISLETGAPSFVLAWRAARKAFKQYGLADFEVPEYYSLLFESY